MQGKYLSEVYYHPIGAATRWAGLWRFRDKIASVWELSHSWQLPEKFDCPRYAELHLCVCRIYDAIFHGELPYGKNGITMDDKSLWNAPELTVRHVDLKRWMLEHYPDQRPTFLFTRRERNVHPAISMDAAHALIVEREALKSQLEQCRRQLPALREQRTKQGQAPPSCDICPVSDRAETTYLNIIGGMLELILGQSPSGTPYSCFKTQEAVVSALVAHHGGTMGITERTLNGKFAVAKRRLHSGDS